MAIHRDGAARSVYRNGAMRSVYRDGIYAVDNRVSTPSELRFALPRHTTFGGSTMRIRWQDTTSGLGDVSALAASTGTVHLIRLQFNANLGDADNNISLRTSSALGSSGQSSGPHLSSDWETAAVGLKLEVAGLGELSVAGPANSAHSETDSSEPYRWEPGDDYTNGAITYTDANGDAGELDAWTTDFAAAYANDNTLRATLAVPLPSG